LVVIPFQAYANTETRVESPRSKVKSPRSLL
jgi:hypothetical protein